MAEQQLSKIQVYVPESIWEATKIAAVRAKTSPRSIVAAALTAYLVIGQTSCPADTEEETRV